LNATIRQLGDRPRESGRRIEQDTLRAMLRAEREAKGITAQDLSLRLQMHQTYVSRMERGYRSIDVVELLDILDAMGVESKEFIGRYIDAVKSAKPN
jgi:transcriptional regulator with XRE-family HTH domain